MKRAWMAMGLVATALLTVGCQNKMYDENRDLRRQFIESQSENDRLKAELAGRPDAGKVNADMQAMRDEIAKRDAALAEMQTQMNKPTPGEAPADTSLGGITISRDDKAGTVTVNVPGDVLFASGEAKLKDSAKATLTKIAGILNKDFAGKKFTVDGYTDTDPIVRTKDLWKDNLDLSASRARAVADYLKSQSIDAKRVGVRAMGDTSPKSDKAKSRRVEIVVITR